MKKSRGFSLAELVVAINILALVGYLILESFPQSLLLVDKSTRITQAAAAASGLLDTLQNEATRQGTLSGLKDRIPSIVEEFPGFQFFLSMKPLAGFSANRIVEARVTVSWKDESGKVSEIVRLRDLHVP